MIADMQNGDDLSLVNLGPFALFRIFKGQLAVENT